MPNADVGTPRTRLLGPIGMEVRVPPAVLKFAYRYRGELVALPLVYALLCSWHEYENEPILWLAAGITFMLGFALRVWSQQHLHFRLKMEMALTNTGPYSLVRNPIYIGNTLICMALTIGSEVMWLLPVTLLNCVIVYAMVVRHEESHLTEKYGEEYLAYMQQVPRWIPRRLSGAKLQWSRDYLRVSLRAEAYNLLLIVPLLLKEILIK